MKTIKTFTNSLSLIFLLSTGILFGQTNIIIDGSFENHNTFGCDYNNGNSAFNAVFADVTAFGPRNEICIMKGNPCFGNSAPVGATKLGLAYNNVQVVDEADQISMNLTTPIIGGHNYKVSFWADALLYFSAGHGRVRVGVSNSNAAFGTPVVTSDIIYTVDDFVKYTYTFKAPHNADYLTTDVVDAETGRTWIHLDGYELEDLGPAAFVTTWETTAPAESITIPIVPISGYDFDVEWGDGSVTTGHGVSNPATHSYATPGQYQVSITGTFPRIYFNNTGDKDKILSVDQWGCNQWKSSMSRAFFGCSNLDILAPDTPDLSKIRVATLMFKNCTSLTGGLDDWDVSTLEYMQSMFENCTSLSGGLDNWDVSKVIYLSNMFKDASNYNGDISGWDVSKVRFMQGMFRNAGSFNQNIGAWPTTALSKTNLMFDGASAFDQDLSGWDVTPLTNASRMYSNSGMSIANYDATLTGWATQAINNNVPVGGHGVYYCSAEADRQALIDNNNWYFVGDDILCPGANRMGADALQFGEQLPFQNEAETSLEMRNKFATELNVYPNPVQDILNIELPLIKEDFALRLFDQLGQLIWQDTFKEGEDIVTLQTNDLELSNGTYLVQLQSKNTQQIKKIVLLK